MNHFGRWSDWMLLAALPIIVLACSSPAPTPGLPDDGYVDVPGGRVAFRVIGEAGEVPLLVIHGGPGGSSCSYVTTFTGIAEERPVVVYDQLGSGYSDRITDLERYGVLSRFVEEVTAIRNELGLDQVHLMGKSWGATVALEYMLTANPTGVLSLSLVGPLVSTPRWLQDANDLVADLSEESQAAVKAAIESGDFESEAFQAANSEFSSNFGVRTPGARQALTACAASPRGGSGLYQYMWGPSEFLSTGTLREYDRLDRLPELDLPVLFLAGEYDEARPATMREFQALVPGSVVTILPDAGHGSNVDQPELFNAAVREFLAGVEGR